MPFSKPKTRTLFGVETTLGPLRPQAVVQVLGVLRECTVEWGLSPVCLTPDGGNPAWEDFDAPVSAGGWTDVKRIALPPDAPPVWFFVHLDPRLSCAILVEMPERSSNAAWGLVRFDSEWAARLALAIDPESSSPQAPSDDSARRDDLRAVALERFSERLTRLEPPAAESDELPQISIPYIEELLGLSSLLSNEQDAAGLLAHVVNATARLSDYRLVLVSLFKDEYPYRDIIGCDAIPSEALQKLQRMPFSRDEFRRTLRCGVLIRVGSLGVASYFPPGRAHFIDTDPVFKSPTPYDGGPGRWNKTDELFVPIIGQSGEYLGVISLDDPRSGRAPDEQSLLPVIAFARQISLILERRRVETEMETMLYQLSVNNSELAGLNAVLEMTSRSMDRQGVLEGALKTLEVVDLEAAAILTLDESKRELQLEHISNASQSLSRTICDFGVECFTVGLKVMRGEIEVHDVKQLAVSSPHVKQVLDDEKIRTLVTIPLFSRNGVLGVMVLWSHEKRNFSEQDCRLLLNIGKQVGLAIEATHLYERSTLLAGQMQALFEVGKSINSHLALEPLLDSVTQNAATLLGADEVSVVLFDENQAMTAMANWSRKTDLSAADARQALHSSNSITLISLPITATHPQTGEARQLGMFSVARNALNRQTFSPVEIEMLENLTSHVSIAVENARAFEAQRKHNKQIMLINAFLRGVGAILDPERMLESAARIIRESFDYTRVSISKHDEPSDELRVAAVAGNSPEPPSPVGLRAERAQKPMYQAFETRKTVKLADVRKAGGGSRLAPETRSLLVVPLVRRDSVWGVLALEHKEVNHFAENDVIMAEILADGLSVGLSNAELYSEVTASNAKLQELIRIKDDLVSMVAHDFRSPLTTIQAFSEVMAEHTEDAKSKRYLEIINRQSRHLARLANDTLTMSRLESHKMNFEFQPVNIRDMIELLLDARFGQTNVTFEPAWPETPVVVSGDSARLQEVFDNLIGNAVKYSPDGGTVKIVADANNGGVVVAVRDQGIGMSAEDLPKLFEKFQRLDNARKLKIPGTGLGLYICRAIIEAHGGSIEAESELGKGSTFRVRLPRAT